MPNNTPRPSDNKSGAGFYLLSAFRRWITPRLADLFLQRLAFLNYACEPPRDNKSAPPREQKA